MVYANILGNCRRYNGQAEPKLTSNSFPNGTKAVLVDKSTYKY